jgi:hypothetical protein
MKKLLHTACCACLCAITPISLANAHNLTWRDGVSRQVGYGHCAKGPCMNRTCWAPSRPHRHESGQVIIDRYGSPECWIRYDHETRLEQR